jgi:glutamate-1-semialdehyde 2,1-aminomutase
MTTTSQTANTLRADLAARTPTSRELFERAKRMIPNGSSSAARLLEPYPFFAREGRGGHIFDEDGNRYIDCRLGYGPMLVGHAHPKVVAAVRSAAEHGFVFGAPHRLEAELAERIVLHSRCAEKVGFCSSGTEATLHALRIARAATGRARIAKFEGGYHGIHDGVALNIHAIGDETVDGELARYPETLGVPRAASDLTCVLPYNDDRAFTIIEEHANELAAVIVEPMLGVGGALPAETGFLERLRAVTLRHGIVLIFDEVITGFRLALGGAQESSGVTPDLVTYGKPIGGGLPIGVVAGIASLMDLLESTGDAARNRNERVMFGGTSNGNPLSMAAGLATIEVLESHGTRGYAALSANGDRLRSAVNDAAASLGLDFHMTGQGPVFASHFMPPIARSPRDLRAEDKRLQKDYGLHLLRRGVFLNPTHAFLSFAHSEPDLDAIIDAHVNALRDVAATA